jgi:hypothetical protein
MKLHYAILLLLLPVVSRAGSPLDQRMSLRAIEPWLATKVIEFVGKRTDLAIDLSPAVATNSVQLRLATDNLDAQTILDWALYFLHAEAVVTGAVLRVRQGTPPVIPAAKPLSASPILAQPYPQTKSFTHDADVMLEYVLHHAKFGNVVMEPACPEFLTKVHLNPQGRSSADIIADLCGQAGLECTLRGKVLFIRRKEPEVPNKTHGHVPSKAAADGGL